MNKLALDLNALEVQSFATDDAAGRVLGTVLGRQRGSEVDACPSARGCSERAECRPTQGADCPSARECETGKCTEDACPTDACYDSDRGCTPLSCPGTKVP